MKDFTLEELEFYKAAETFALRMKKNKFEAAAFAEKQILSARKHLIQELPYSAWV
ncbi:hypothetical protein [Pseudomonas lundensis]|uniref:hypothetical protein n=1 Tax=Pseudomonas lundensis TaxID=86185 RepID=UPI000AFC2279|nr:hypothetical protein [Pseudomonas lundensis]